jgi:peptidoglycan/xylan/chitin deacetylase (PgdA/CDA1 family)
MKTSFSSKLHRKVQQFQKRFAVKSLILMYHRVAEVELDPWGLCITPKNFAEQLAILQQSCHPLSLQQFLQAYQDDNLPKRSVVITFDDGYVDNLLIAKPLLEHYGIPATIFVSTGYLGGKREFWWDALEQILLQPGKLPERLLLKINGHVQEWQLGTAMEYSQEEYQRDRHCTTRSAHANSRLSFYYQIWHVLRPLSEQERIKVLDELTSWAGITLNTRSTQRCLLPEELVTLAQGELIEIGAHTITHPFLSAQSPLEQHNEIQQSKIELEEIIDRPVNSFSYPFGDYTLETVELVRNSKLDCACSTVAESAWRGNDRFQLPRLPVENWQGAEFAQQLLRWFHV